MSKQRIDATVKVLLWIRYNRKADIDMSDVSVVASEFVQATGKAGKYCTCKNEGKAVNDFWEDWHCTYCLKPKKN